MNEQRNVSSVWLSMFHEINKATVSLMYLLQGMELVRRGDSLARHQTPPNEAQSYTSIPRLSYLDVPLGLNGPASRLDGLLGREGRVEQQAFKGWVEDVYYLWESRYRGELSKALSGPGSFKVQGEAIGDFRRIRNDLIHNNGVASREHTGKCEVLKWFQPGEPIVLGMQYVLDFLNQMGLMKDNLWIVNDGPTTWLMLPWCAEEELRARRPIPELVSLRTSVDKELEDGTLQCVASVVFENGVFVNLAVLYVPDGRSARERSESFHKARIDENRDIRFHDGLVLSKESLYQGAVDALFGKGPQLEGWGVPGPAFKIGE